MQDTRATRFFREVRMVATGTAMLLVACGTKDKPDADGSTASGGTLNANGGAAVAGTSARATTLVKPSSGGASASSGGASDSVMSNGGFGDNGGASASKGGAGGTATGAAATGGVYSGSGGVGGAGAGATAAGGIQTGTGGKGAGGASSTATGGTSSGGKSAVAGGAGTSGASGGCATSVDSCGICGGDGRQCQCHNGTVVGYSTVGDTCGINGVAGALVLPRIALNEQEYASFFTGSGYISGDLSNSSSKGCGACLQVTGPNGSVVGIVNEVADITAVGQYGQPGNVTLEQNYLLGISGTAGPQRTSYRPVPCPVTLGMGFRYASWGNGNPWIATFITVIHHRYPLAALEIRPQGTSTWYALKRDWVNRWHLETYLNSPAMPVPSPVSTPPEYRITSIYGDVVVTGAVPWPEPHLTGGDSQPDGTSETTYQFASRPSPAQACEYPSL